MGPNCLGLMLPHQGINTTFDPVSPKPGNISFISQSGAIITTIVDWSLPEEIGFSAVISVGNQADLTFEDFIQFAGDDPGTKAIILYIEQIQVRETVHGDRAPRCPEKTGRGHQVRVLAHRAEGCILPYRLARGQLRRVHGSVPPGRCHSGQFHPRGIPDCRTPRIGGISERDPGSRDHQCRGVCRPLIGLCRDNLASSWSSFPQTSFDELDAVLPADWSRENPIDMVGDSSADRFARTFDIMIENQDLWDIAFVIAVPSAISDPIRVANEMVRFSKNTHKMIVGCMIGGDSMKTPLRILRDAQIPNFPDLEDAFRAVGNICRHRLQFRRVTRMQAGLVKARIRG